MSRAASIALRTRWLVFAAGVVCACKRSPTTEEVPAQTSAPSDGASASVTGGANASLTGGASASHTGGASPAPEPRVLESELGFAEPPRLPKLAAQRQNDAALAALRAANLDAAEAAARQALALDASYDLARFNLACVLTRKGALRDASAELSLLLKRDLPRFYPRLLADTDLSALRVNSVGVTLLARAEQLAVTWLSLARLGVPVNAWVRHIPIETEAVHESYHSRPELLRTGVWLAKPKRFLPLGPEIPKTLAALIDPLAGRGVSIVGDVDPCLFDLCPRLGKVQLVQHESLHPARPASTTSRSAFTAADLVPTLLIVELSARDLRWTTHPERGPWFSIHQHASLGPKAPARMPPAPSMWLGGEQVEVGPLGTRLSGLPAGFRGPPADCYYRDCKETLHLPGGRTVDLGPSFDGVQSLQVVLAPPRHAVVVGNWPECVCGHGERPDLRHQLAVVELDSGKLTPWLQGTLSAAVRVGPDGSVYVQREDAVQRFENVGSLSDAEPLPRGLVLTPPEIQSEDCCGL